MSRSLQPLTAETLADVPLPCRGCMFWEAADAPRGGDPAGIAAKRAWVRAVTAAWGPPGRVLYVDDRPAGFSVLVPGEHAGRAARLSRPPSADALLLTTMWIDKESRGAGLGRVLLQTALRDAHDRGSRAVEAYGRRWLPPPGSCVLTERFLLANGFTVLHEDPRLPLLRLDLRKTVRWQESIAAALERAQAVVSRRRLAPAHARSAHAPASRGLT